MYRRRCQLENNNGILLESGTNELEVIMFGIGRGTFGINVMKVREIIQPVDVTIMPHSHPHMEGIIRLREEIIPVIDLSEAIGFDRNEGSAQTDKLIVSELNQMKVAFRVHEVSRIHRISWEQIEKPNEMSQGLKDLTIGVVKMEDNMVLLLDYEKIVYDVVPDSRLDGSGEEESRPERASRHVLIAEDSNMLRQLLDDTLQASGYTSLTFTGDGREAWEKLTDARAKAFDVVITDIEMPGMDGHHLTKKIKESSEWKDVPVIIFSSLITGDLYHKGERVGADAQISKPQAPELVDMLDKMTGLKAAGV